MTFASFFLGTVIASVFGCAFHFWHGGGLKWLIFFNLLSWLGFWLGHIIGALTGVRFLPLGPIVILFLGFWLSMFNQETRSN